MKNMLNNSSILILGMGKEGIGTLKYFLSVLPEKKITIADALPVDKLSSQLQEIISKHSNIKLCCGKNYLNQILKHDIIVKSAGIPPDLLFDFAPDVDRKKIISHTSLFFENTKGFIIGISGTKGKSTTSSLIYNILKQANLNVHLVGNIGHPPLPLLINEKDDAIYVYELSSFQLESLKQSPNIAVLLNIMQEHLDYHKDFESYISAKSNIYRFQTDDQYFVYNKDCLITKNLAVSAKAMKREFSLQSKIDPAIFINDIELLGEFNIYNKLAAINVSRILDIPYDLINKGFKSFTPLEHRLEKIGCFKDIIFYNDSIATIPQAAMSAIKALEEDNKVKTIILGGKDRGIDYSDFGLFLTKTSIENIILFPDTGDKIEFFIKKKSPQIYKKINFFHTSSMKQAVLIAYKCTKKNTICLLSPAASSFGLFKNYIERGRLFKQYVIEFGT